MASLLCVKNLTGDVKVHDQAIAEDLNQDETDTYTTQFMPRARPKSKRESVKRPQSTPNLPTHKHAFSMEPVILSEILNKQDTWLDRKQVMDMQDKVLVEASSMHQALKPVLEMEETFVKDVNDYLDHNEFLELRKRELLHKNWNHRVYEPIRHKILSAMNSQDWVNKDRRRRELHRQYLEYINKKGHVFLDTMDKGEYYAQALNGHRPAPITVQTENLHDPLLAQGRERNKEDQVVLRCLTGEIYSHDDVDQVKLPPLPLVPLGRHGADSTTWLEMPLGNIESTPRRASRMRMKGTNTDTQIDFSHWSKRQVDPVIVDQEMQLQKRRMFEEKPPYGLPARQFAKAPFASETTSSEHKALCSVGS